MDLYTGPDGPGEVRRLLNGGDAMREAERTLARTAPYYGVMVMVKVPSSADPAASTV